jgi:transmembrane sensor
LAEPSDHSTVEVDPSALSAAAAWRVRVADGMTGGDWAEFELWIENARNAQAFAAADGAWRVFDDVAAEPEIVLLRSRALQGARKAARQRWINGSAAKKMFRLIGPVAAGIILTVALVLGLAAQHPDRKYATAPGERRMIRLEDGSRVVLDEDTEVTTHFSRQARSLQLLRGQARFEVAHDVQRPFSVTARTHSIVAVGTIFNVDLLDSKLLVTLVEGRVLVRPSGQAGASAPTRGAEPVLTLSAGEQLIQQVGVPTVVVPHVNPGEASAWQHGKLIFDNELLSDAVARVNRYSHAKLAVADHRAADQRISGVFDTGDTSAFVEGVTSYLPVRAVRASGGGIELRSSPEG